jgi:hypothetical protein
VIEAKGFNAHDGTGFSLARLGGLKAAIITKRQGVFEAEFEEGILVRAKAGDVYSEPIAKIHRGHNPHPELAYLCIGFCITAPDREPVTNVASRPW